MFYLNLLKIIPFYERFSVVLAIILPNFEDTLSPACIINFDHIENRPSVAFIKII